MKHCPKARLLLLFSLAVFTIIPTSISAMQNSFSGVKDDFTFGSQSENDIYAIANDANIWHWNGAWWWQVTYGRTIEERIHVSAPDLIYGLSRDLAGNLNVYKWAGTSWSQLTSDGPILDDFAFISEKKIYAIGEDNQICLWNGFSWEKITSGETGIKNHIQVYSNSQIYGIGLHQEILKWNGATWQVLKGENSAEEYFFLKSEQEIFTISTNQNLCLLNQGLENKVYQGLHIERKLVVNSPAEIYSLGPNDMIWQWNGEKWVQITDSTTDKSTISSTTFYKAKFIEGILESPAAIIAFKNRLIIAGRGIGGAVYVREWEPLRNESWDSSRNSQNLGVNQWYPLEGGTSSTPELKIENGTLIIYVNGNDGTIYKKEYLHPYQWSSSWEPARDHIFSPGPFNAAGFTVIPSKNSYPSTVSLVKSKDYVINQSQPSWLEDLIIYEVVTKQFTSPNGPGTGNFNSLKEKLDYIADLGVTAIWISGHSWSDPQHFTNISTQYANIHPALLDPTLGSDPHDIKETENEFKDLVQEAHKRGIKIILDVISHGVMSYSPLVTEDPTLPNYVENHPQQSPITPHPDWFGAQTYPADESEVGPRDPFSIPYDTMMIDFVGGYDQNDLDDWWVEIWTNYVLKYGIDGLRIDLGSSRYDLWAKVKENAHSAGQDLIIFPEGELDNYPFDIGVYDFEQTSWEWLPFAAKFNDIPNPAYGTVITDMKKAQQEVFPNLDRQYYVIPVSCHDSMSYNLQGSRFEMGYGAFFTPFIPLFMAGEEFNNPNTPISNCTIDWLLASELQWDKLNDFENQRFLDDVRKAIKIRESEPALSYFSLKANNPNVVVVEDFSSTLSESPAPYLRFVPNSNESILIVGNSNPSYSNNILMNVPLEKFDLDSFNYLEIKDLWSGKTSIVSRQEMNHFDVTVTPDNFRILKITPYLGEIVNVPLMISLALVTIALIFIIIVIINKSRKRNNKKK
jgi:hypothetical protein